MRRRRSGNRAQGTIPQKWPLRAELRPGSGWPFQSRARLGAVCINFVILTFLSNQRINRNNYACLLIYLSLYLGTSQVRQCGCRRSCGTMRQKKLSEISEKAHHSVDLEPLSSINGLIKRQVIRLHIQSTDFIFLKKLEPVRLKCFRGRKEDV